MSLQALPTPSSWDPSVDHAVGRDGSISIPDSRDPEPSSQLHETSPIRYIADSPTLGTTPQVNLTAIAQSSAPFDAGPVPKQSRSMQEAQSRLTVHQNQMTSFGESFPADLVIPPQFQKKTNDAAAGDRTPTQADFPPPWTTKDDVSHGQYTPNAAQPSSSSIPQGHSSPVADRSKLGTPISDLNRTMTEEGASLEQRPSGSTRHFSFIEFGAVPSDELSLQSPMTPLEETSFEDRLSETDHSAFRTASIDGDDDTFHGRRGPLEPSPPLSNPSITPASRSQEPFENVPSSMNSYTQSGGGAHILHRPDSSQSYGIEKSPERLRRGKRQILRAQTPNSADSPYASSPARSNTASDSPGIESKPTITGRRKKRGSMFSSLGGGLASQPSTKQENKPTTLERSRTDLQKDSDRGSPAGQSKAPIQHERSKSQNMLFRSSTSGVAAVEKGKKNRFSAFGVSGKPSSGHNH